MQSPLLKSNSQHCWWLTCPDFYQKISHLKCFARFAIALHSQGVSFHASTAVDIRSKAIDRGSLSFEVLSSTKVIPTSITNKNINHKQLKEKHFKQKNRFSIYQISSFSHFHFNTQLFFHDDCRLKSFILQTGRDLVMAQALTNNVIVNRADFVPHSAFAIETKLTVNLSHKNVIRSIYLTLTTLCIVIARHLLLDLRSDNVYKEINH